MGWSFAEHTAKSFYFSGIGKKKIGSKTTQGGNVDQMPSVGMRRTTRVFGVVKGVDGARVLRSGRRLSLQSGKGKLEDNYDGDEWLKLFDNSGVGINCQKRGWSEMDSGLKDTEIKNGEPEKVLLKRLFDSKKHQTADKMFGIVYSRKRKRLVVPSSDVSYNSRTKMDIDRMYGIHFVRRKWRSRVGDRPVHTGNYQLMIISVVSELSSSTCRYCCLLSSVLSYMAKVRLTLRELSAFLFSDPIASAFRSSGIHFVQGIPSSRTRGICKIFGTRLFIPMFSLDFSAVPYCFMHIHLSMQLRYAHMVFACVICPLGNNTDPKRIANSGEAVSCTSPDIELMVSRDVNCVKRILNVTSGSPQNARKNTRGTVRRKSHSVRGKRSSLGKRRTRPSSLGVQKANNRALGPDLFGVRTGSIPVPASIAGQQLRRSTRRSSSIYYSPVASIRELKSSTVDTKVDLDSTSCMANLLVIESDRCYREEGFSISLENSSSEHWVLTVRRNGSTRYNLKAQKVMRPCVSNRVTHAVVWTGEDGWKLEFINRQDWLIFKELYKECYERNMPVVAVAAAPVVRNIPVPSVREVPAYWGDITTPFSRPSTYITMHNDEVSRVLAQRIANYDMDSEDEEWLNKFNEEFFAESTDCDRLSEETFELAIDAFEKASYCSPDDYFDQRALATLCPDLGRREAIEAVCSYWTTKRKQKRVPLLRVFQSQQPRKSQVITGPVLRKKRSFKRQMSQAGKGKHRSVLQAMVAEQVAVDEQTAMRKVEEAKAYETKSMEVAVHKRKRAQLLMESADWAAYKAAMTIRIAETAQFCESRDPTDVLFL